MIKSIISSVGGLFGRKPKVDCFIIHFNRPSLLDKQLKILSLNSRLRLYVVDNASVLENRSKVKSICSQFGAELIQLERNLGHQVVWLDDISRAIAKNSPYIVTDCDVLPPEGVDYLSVLEQGLDQYPRVTKVGLELNVSRIPLDYPRRDEVIHHEREFIYRKSLDGNFQEAPVDTTFALYRGGYHSYSVWGTKSNDWGGKCLSLRTVNSALEADHLGWYMVPPYDEETKKYFEIIRGSATGHWKQ